MSESHQFGDEEGHAAVGPEHPRKMYIQKSPPLKMTTAGEKVTGQDDQAET